MIKSPMDLQTMRFKLASGAYCTLHQGDGLGGGGAGGGVGVAGAGAGSGPCGNSYAGAGAGHQGQAHGYGGRTSGGAGYSDSYSNGGQDYGGQDYGSGLGYGYGGAVQPANESTPIGAPALPSGSRTEHFRSDLLLLCNNGEGGRHGQREGVPPGDKR